jgi:ABC-2 type transport system permease protein
MVYHIWKQFQMTAKCLLRSKAFLFFVFVLPILATLILNIKNTGDVISKEGKITELNDLDAQVAYLNDFSMLPVKVYDKSSSKVTTELLVEMQQTGMFQIYRVNASKASDDSILESAKHTANNDKVGAILVIGNQFEQGLMAGKEDSISLYKVGEDERYDLFHNTLKSILLKYALLGKKSSTPEQFLQNVKKYKAEVPVLQKVESDGGNGILGLNVDHKKTGVFGGTLAVLTIAFVITGILILNTIIKEKENLVHTRILLTKASDTSYLLSKFAVVFFTSFIQTIVAVGSYCLLVGKDVGISVVQFAFIVFLMGLIFNFISVCIGVFARSTMTALYLSFIVWMITALIGGMYFDISSASKTFQRIAMLMPQRWGLKAASMFMNGNMSGYPLLLVVTVAYLIVIMVASVIGIRINRKE